MKIIPVVALCSLFFCLAHSGKTQVTISAEARGFCNRLKQSASLSNMKIVDSVARNYPGSSITEKDLMEIIDGMGKAGDAAKAIAMLIVFTIAEAPAETPITAPSNKRDSLKNNIRAGTSRSQTLERKQQAVILTNSMFNKNVSRQNQLLRSLN